MSTTIATPPDHIVNGWRFDQGGDRQWGYRHRLAHTPH